MLVRFFRHKKADQGPAVSAGSAIGYVLGTHDANGNPRSEPAELLRGDPGRWEQIAAHGRHAGKYTSGALCFDATDKPTDAQLDEIMQSFERTLLPGLDPEQYAACWVRHEDKGRTELHFLFAGEELVTGKRLNAYYHHRDGQRVNAWKDITNADHGFADPNSPERRQALRFNHAMPPAKQELVKEIHEWIEHLVANGEIENRDDVIEEIKKIPLEIARETKKSISIVNPDGGKNIRLSGEFYERDFKASEQAPEAIQRRLEEYRREHENRIEEARTLYRELYKRAEKRNEERYSQPAPEKNISSDPIFELPSVDGSSPGHSDDIRTPGQDIGNQAPERPEPDPVQPGGDDRQPTGLQAEEIKQQENNKNEADKQRNRSLFKELSRSIRAARKSFAEAYKSAVTATRELISRSPIDRKELQSDHAKLQGDSGALGREREARSTVERGIAELERHAERLARHKIYESDAGLSY